MSLHWFIAKRYLWSKRRHPFVGVVSTISILGISVGVAALICVLAVMNGFDRELRSHILGMRAHLVVEKEGGRFDDPLTVMQSLRAASPQVKGVAPYVEGQAILQVDEWGTGVLVRGIDPIAEKNVSKFFEYLKEGKLSNEPGSIVIGTELAKRARLKIGSTLRMATQNTQKPLDYRVEGIFSSGMYEYDANLTFMSMKGAQTLFDLGDSVSGISVYLKDEEAAEKVKRELQKKLGYPHTIQSWMDMNRTLFSALQLEKTVMFLILALIVLVACLNIAGCLTILVMNKTRDIGVLKALGATPGDLLRIFAFDGLALGLSGAFFGFLTGSAVCWVLKNTKLIELPKEIYYIDRLPIVMNPVDTAMVLSVAVLLSFLSAFYPASMAAKLDPVKALRYE